MDLSYRSSEHLGAPKRAYRVQDTTNVYNYKLPEDRQKIRSFRKVRRVFLKFDEGMHCVAPPYLALQYLLNVGEDGQAQLAANVDLVGSVLREVFL